jgi:pyruvate formate lyase activating enzyme
VADSANSGVVFNLMRYSVRDGPGIRTTVFLKGCPLRCWWCHNPESQAPGPELIYKGELCLACGDCVRACPEHALALGDSRVAENGACRLCGMCVETCPAGARDMIGRTMVVAEVLREVEKDRVFYDESGGGVTFSGGEPLAQPQFLEALLTACRQRRIHVAVDTSGAAPREVVLRVAALADLVLYDLKVLDAARHRQYVGCAPDLIVSNLEAVVAAGHAVEVRIPIIPGANDGPEDVEQFAATLQRLRLGRVHLLAYHHTGAGKYRRLGLEYRMDGVAPPSSERLAEVARQFEAHGVAVKIGA